MKELDQFYLVGGTALALQIGHRLSIDLDLFSDSPFDVEELLRSLPEDSELLVNRSWMFRTLTNKVKCDFVHFPHPRKNPLIMEGDIRMADKLEIGGMKLWAITNRGSKKDFVDLYFLLREFNMKELMDFFRIKFPQAEMLMVLRSLVYFVDADEDEPPVMLIPADWSTIKDTIRKAVEEYVMTGRN